MGAVWRSPAMPLHQRSEGTGEGPWASNRTGAPVRSRKGRIFPPASEQRAQPATRPAPEGGNPRDLPVRQVGAGDQSTRVSPVSRRRCGPHSAAAIRRRTCPRSARDGDIGELGQRMKLTDADTRFQKKLRERV